MSDSTSSDRQRIIPYLYYEDGGAALEFLCKAFGFEELFAVKRADGSLMHGEVGYQSNVVALGTPLDESGSPKQSLRGLLVGTGNAIQLLADLGNVVENITYRQFGTKPFELQAEIILELRAADSSG